MTRTTRRVIFYCAAFIFLAIGYVAILYAQGYRYDFSQAKFSRTGAISLRTNTQAQVLINGVFKDNTSFITNSSSVSGLLPGVYTVSVQKENYSKWQKRVTIQEGFVQDFPHVLLLPTVGEDYNNVVKEIQELLYTPTPSPTTPKPTPKPSPSPTPTPDTSAPYYIDQSTLYVQSVANDGPVSIAVGVSNTYQSTDNQKLIWAVGNQVWVYWLNDQNEQPFHKQGDIAVIGRFNTSVKAMAWFRDSTHITLDVDTLKVIELDTRGGQNVISL